MGKTNKTMNARTQNKRNSHAPRTREKVTGTCGDVRIDPLYETESKTGNIFSKRSKSLGGKNFSKNSEVKSAKMERLYGKTLSESEIMDEILRFVDERFGDIKKAPLFYSLWEKLNYELALKSANLERE